jgi:hypothetical protein
MFWRIGSLAVCLWFTMLSSVPAKPVLNINDPLCFFTTVADKMLRNTFSFGVTNIPVYVNGQFIYSPAVNRVLQLAANVYDASTNSFYPDVFRPIFEHDNSGNVFIVGYTNLFSASGPNTVSGENDPQLTSPLDVLTLTNWGPSYALITTNGGDVNVYGVPWIIGAKKGFPSFNKFGMQTIVQVARRLQVIRSTIPTILGTTTFQTNQLLTFNINNTLNADCWNSYSNSYNNPVDIYALDTLSMAVTNNYNPIPTYFYDFQISSNTVVPRWAGYTNNGNVALSFTNPLSATAILLTNSGFYFGTAPPGITGFSSGPAGWESNNFSFQFPQIGLLVTNRLQLFMLDYSNNISHVIDYVQFGGPQTTLDITAVIETNNPTTIGYGSDMWSQSINNNNGVPFGILSQMDASLLPITANGGTVYWADTVANQAEIEGFAEYMGMFGPYPGTFQSDPGVVDEFTTNYVVEVPFTPMATISKYTSWQANDPLVHYLASDLTFNGVEKTTGVQTGTQVTYGSLSDPPIVPSPAFNVVNDHYQPWGIQYTINLAQTGSNAVVPSPYGLAVKDPLVWSADYWDFPTNLLSDLTGLGQVHRGTPWQTIYFKGADVLQILDTAGDAGSGTNTWVSWTGDNNIPDAATMAPINDRQLASLLISLLNTNDPSQLMSVNDPNINDWLNVLNGLTVFSNSMSLPTFTLPVGIRLSPTYDAYVMASNSPQAETIVTNIAQTRAAQPNGNFYKVGDILSALELTENSPWLDTTNANQIKYGISDAVYEAIPAQLLLLLRPDSIGALSLTNGVVNVQFSGSDAYHYELQESTDLVNWIPISTNSPVQGSFNVSLPSAPNSPETFYRSVLLP